MRPKEIDHEKQWKYAQPELERRFLITPAPEMLEKLRYKEITDKYLTGTNLRLRRIQQAGSMQFKLTKKLPVALKGRTVQWVSTIYLNEEEYRIFENLPGDKITKKRYHLPLGSGQEAGIDEITLGNEQLWILEIEFNEDESLEISLPFAEVREITNDKRYFGSELAKNYNRKF